MLAPGGGDAATLRLDVSLEAPDRRAGQPARTGPTFVTHGFGGRRRSMRVPRPFAPSRRAPGDPCRRDPLGLDRLVSRRRAANPRSRRPGSLHGGRSGSARTMGSGRATRPGTKFSQQTLVLRGWRGVGGSGDRPDGRGRSIDRGRHRGGTRVRRRRDGLRGRSDQPLGRHPDLGRRPGLEAPATGLRGRRTRLPRVDFGRRGRPAGSGLTGRRELAAPGLEGWG